MPPYVHPAMAQMASCLKEPGGRLRLARYILKCEETYSPRIHLSRLTSRKRSTYTESALFLLSQIPNDALEAILNNTLVEKCLSQRLRLRQWQKIDFNTVHSEQNEPGIYVNYLADEEGKGPSIRNYETFVDNVYSALLGRNQTTSFPNLIQRIDEAHRKLSGKQTSLMDEVLEKKAASREDMARVFRRAQLGLIKVAKEQKATTISIPAEVGWAKNMNKRVKQHRKFESSPYLFRIAQCVLSMMFDQPNAPRKYQMYSICIFRAFSWEHAEIGESLASNLLASYGKYGGWNFTQAGISIKSSRTNDAEKWLSAATKNRATIAYVGVQLNTLSQELNDYSSKIDNFRKQMDEEDDIARTLQAQKKLDARLNFDAVDKYINRCETRLNEMDKEDSQIFKDTELMSKALQELVTGLGLVPYTYSQSQSQA
ncbi:hypothetical protein KCU93_g5896, partial [Aureobasidium melanogenum]